LRMADAWTFVRLSVWWLPFNCLWTAFLTQGLQVRVEHLAPPEAKGGALATLTAIGAALSLASQVFAGPLSDQCSHPLGRRRPFLLVGTISSLPFLFAFAWLENFWFVVISFALLQWFLNLAAAPTRALLPDLVPPENTALLLLKLACGHFSVKLRGWFPLEFCSAQITGGSGVSLWTKQLPKL